MAFLGSTMGYTKKRNCVHMDASVMDRDTLIKHTYRLHIFIP